MGQSLNPLAPVGVHILTTIVILTNFDPAFSFLDNVASEQNRFLVKLNRGLAVLALKYPWKTKNLYTLNSLQKYSDLWMMWNFILRAPGRSIFDLHRGSAILTWESTEIE